MDVFGPNLATVAGKEWHHQRKLTAPAFSEANCRLVWSESLRQTTQMTDYCNKSFPNGASTLSDDFMTLTLHVLCQAGFGLTYEFESEKSRGDDGTPSYKYCFADILGSAVLMIALPPWRKNSRYLPKRIRSFITHRDQLRVYMNEMVQTGRLQAERILDNKGEKKPNILSTLLLESEQARRGLLDDESAPTEKAPSKRGLSGQEILGNLFIFGFAGHETTAHTITYATYLLAAYPEWQDWLFEEIDEVMGSPAPFNTLDYDETFHKLVRTRSLMYESLRLYPLVNALSRSSYVTAVSLPLHTHVIALPPRTKVFPNVAALHAHPSWGPDAAAFRPSRFLSSSPFDTRIPKRADETFSSPPKGVPKGAFNAWADGPRACPGRKFAQVEFVAVLVGLLWGWRLEVVREESERDAEARERVKACWENSAVGVTLGMRNPRAIAIKIRRVRR